jgi:hypothetical protein
MRSLRETESRDRWDRGRVDQRVINKYDDAVCDGNVIVWEHNTGWNNLLQEEQRERAEGVRGGRDSRQACVGGIIQSSRTMVWMRKKRTSSYEC